MIKLYVANTHSKIEYKDATDQEIVMSEEILNEKFSAKDESLKRDPLVLKGLKSDIVCFYNSKLNIIPSGLIPYLQIYYDKAKIKYETIDMRKYPIYDKDWIAQDSIRMGVKDARPYQIEAVRAILKYRGGIIKSATGTGKSMIIAMILRAYHKSNIVVMFDKKSLIHQTRENLINDFGFKEEEIGVIQGENFEDNKRITLLSVQSYEKAQHIFPKIRVIMTDETHTTGRSPTAEKIIFSCQNASVKIGLTATTEIDNPAEKMRLFANIGPIVFDAGIKDKIDEGYLAKVTINLYEFDTSSHIPIKGSWGDIYDRRYVSDQIWKDALERSGFRICKVKRKTVAARFIDDKFSKDDAIAGHYTVDEDIAYREIDEYLITPIAESMGYAVAREKGKPVYRKFVEYGDESTHYIFNDERNDFIAQLAQALERCLILYEKREHGLQLLKRLPHAILVDGFSDNEAREKAKKYLADNKEAIVLASGIFNTGVDIPALENYINAGGGKSTVQVIQKLGRTTRKNEGTGKEEAQVHDMYDIFSPISLSQSKKRHKIYEDLELPLIFHDRKVTS